MRVEAEQVLKSFRVQAQRMRSSGFRRSLGWCAGQRVCGSKAFCKAEWGIQRWFARVDPARFI
jgi:hypothetical protein